MRINEKDVKIIRSKIDYLLQNELLSNNVRPVLKYIKKRLRYRK